MERAVLEHVTGIFPTVEESVEEFEHRLVLYCDKYLSDDDWDILTLPVKKWYNKKILEVMKNECS